MKQFLSFLALILLFISAGAQTSEYITTKDFQVEKKKLADGISTAKKSALDAKKVVSLQNQTIDSLSRLLSSYQAHLVMNNDSLSSLNIRVNDLQNQIHDKTSQRSRMIFVSGFIILCVIFLFIWLLMIKRKSDRDFHSLSEAIDKNSSKIDQGLNIVNEDIKVCKEMIKSSADEMNQLLKTGMAHFETRAGSIEQQIRDYAGSIEGRVNKNKEEHDLRLKKQDERINVLQTMTDQKSQELNALISSVEKNQKAITPGIMDNFSSLRTQLEERIKSLSAEISKFKMR